jgi:hypothetical protein
MPDIVIVTSFLALVQSFECYFTGPSFRTFAVLCCGWVMTLGRHTLTHVVRCASVITESQLAPDDEKFHS